MTFKLCNKNGAHFFNFFNQPEFFKSTLNYDYNVKISLNIHVFLHGNLSELKFENLKLKKVFFIF